MKGEAYKCDCCGWIEVNFSNDGAQYIAVDCNVIDSGAVVDTADICDRCQEPMRVTLARDGRVGHLLAEVIAAHAIDYDAPDPGAAEV